MNTTWKNFEVWIDKRDETFEKIEVSGLRRQAVQFAHEVANHPEVRKVTVVGDSGSIVVLDNDHPVKKY